MMDPKRLAVSSGNRLERALLVAGRPALPPTGAKERALVAATAAAATAGLATTTATAGGALLKVTSIVGARWLVVLGLAGVGAGAVGAAVVHGRANHAPIAVATPRNSAPVTVTATGAPALPPGMIAQPPPVSLPAPVVPEPSASSVVVPQTPASSAVVPSPPIASPRPLSAAPLAALPAEAASGSTTREELAWLDGARAAIHSGNPARALSVLDGYGAHFPHGVMAPEATMLRIEALVDAGDRPAARRAAEAFLGANPQSPYAARVRSMVPEANP